MKLKELSGVYYIDKEITRLEGEIKQLECEATKVTPTLSGQPRGSGVTDRVGKLGAVMGDLRTLLEIKHLELIHEKTRLYTYINGIPDALTRLIFQYRFIDCLQWNEVADRIGGNHNEKSVSMICYRYLKDNK